MRLGKNRLPYLVLTVVIAVQLVSCGWILYPEREGQRGGRIDPAVVIMDGLGLLLFLVPGVIAFAVDFATGAIYLPGGRRSDAPEGMKYVKVQADPGGLTMERVAEIVEEHTGRPVPMRTALVFKVKGGSPSTIADVIETGRIGSFSSLTPVPARVLADHAS